LSTRERFFDGRFFRNPASIIPACAVISPPARQCGGQVGQPADVSWAKAATKLGGVATTGAVHIKFPLLSLTG
jgi:hypothetical protein